MSILANLKAPQDICQEIAERLQRVRLNRNMTQRELAERSGVSLGSLRRFERTGDISLGSLVLLAIALSRAGDLDELFVEHEVVDLFKPAPRKRLRASRRPAH